MILRQGEIDFVLTSFEQVNEKIYKYIGLLDGVKKRGFTRQSEEVDLLSELSQIDLDLKGFELINEDA